MDVLDLNSKLELFVDDYLIDSMNGTALKMQKPELHHTTFEKSENEDIRPPSDVIALKRAYQTVIKDGDKYLRFYRLYMGSDGKKYYDGNPFEVTCYEESDDGIHWHKPNLGLFEINGSKDNNVIWANDAPRSHNFSPFIDKRPGVPKNERFKALAGTHKQDRSRPDHAIPFPDDQSGLFAFCSPDGIHWRKMSDKRVLANEQFAFDSQNVSFWSVKEQQYVCYFRTWKDNPKFTKDEIENAPYEDFVKYHLRTISRSTSQDFIHWSEPVALDPNAPGEHLYTSQTHPYFRAEHIYIATPTRFMSSRGNSTNIMLMTTRDGVHYDRTFMEAFVRPGLDQSKWGNRSNYATLNIVPLNDKIMALYLTGERTYLLRTDGFASVNAGATGGTMMTKPFTFTGKELVLNYSTSVAGSVDIEILTKDEEVITGFTTQEENSLIGDEISRIVTWNNHKDLSELEGQEIRLKFSMTDSDIFSLKFK